MKRYPKQTLTDNVGVDYQVGVTELNVGYLEINGEAVILKKGNVEELITALQEIKETVRE